MQDKHTKIFTFYQLFKPIFRCGLIIVGGDGAKWIREGAESLGAEYQYCRFHMERDLRRLFKKQKEDLKAYTRKCRRTRRN